MSNIIPGQSMFPAVPAGLENPPNGAYKTEVGGSSPSTPTDRNPD